jgi:hypothetical protein
MFDCRFIVLFYFTSLTELLLGLFSLQHFSNRLVTLLSVVSQFANQVMMLERERGELRAELAALQRETIELQEARLQSDSPKTSSGNYQNLVETIRHKNKHITQLLSDISVSQ